MVLSIETSTEICSVAVHDSETLIATMVSSEPYSHAERLAPMIGELLSTHNISKNSLTAVAVSAGPGSYTGLRIGAATAKGLCFALDIPLIAINTLESMLVDIPEVYANNLKCPMIDARRMEVYCLLGYNPSSLRKETHALVVDESTFTEYLDQEKIVFYGNGAAKCQSVITHNHAVFLDNITPLAKNVGQLAIKKQQMQEFVDIAYFEPDYLKPYLAIKAKNPLV